MKKIVLLSISVLTILACQSNSTVEVAIENSDSQRDTLAEIVGENPQAMAAADEIDFAQYENLAFGYSNVNMDSVLLMNREAGIPASSYSYIINGEGTASPIAFGSSRTSQPNDNNRSNCYNFENAAGDIYSLKAGLADQWLTTFFMTKEFIQSRQLLVPDKSVKATEDTKNIERIALEKSRKIKQIQPIAKYEGKGELLFVEFEKEADSCLVSLVWMDAEQLTFLDYPAKYNEMSTWRVDDGGEFGFEYYDIIAVFESENGIEVITDWMGAEGSNTNFLLAIEGEFQSVGTAYRYQAPD